jgi:hypothetical protein
LIRQVSSCWSISNSLCSLAQRHTSEEPLSSQESYTSTKNMFWSMESRNLGILDWGIWQWFIADFRFTLSYSSYRTRLWLIFNFKCSTMMCGTQLLWVASLRSINQFIVKISHKAVPA